MKDSDIYSAIQDIQDSVTTCNKFNQTMDVLLTYLTENVQFILDTWYDEVKGECHNCDNEGEVWDIGLEDHILCPACRGKSKED